MLGLFSATVVLLLLWLLHGDSAFDPQLREMSWL